MSQKSVNRSLDDPILDDVDHALGRPEYPLQETSRNHYATELDSAEGRRMVTSNWWQQGKTIPGGLIMFHVTQAGREALERYLDLKANA